MRWPTDVMATVMVPASTRNDLVLLVDDDPVARLLTASALAERQWRVIEADGGGHALELFAENLPDVVVLDALMPDIDGFDTCERLRRLTGGEHVPVLMLTGLDDESSIARAYEAGATDFFVKSTSQWTLLSERLRYMIRASRMREELAESRSKLTKAQRIARLGSWEWNISARWVKLSEECFPIAGLPQQEDGLADWFVWSRAVEDERARIEMLFREALAGAGQMKFECRIARPNGQIRVVHIEAEVDRDEGGPRGRGAWCRAGHHRAQTRGRSDPTASQLRQPDRIAKSPILSRSVRLGARACTHQRHGSGRAVHRSRSIQADQRHAGPSGRRSTAARGGQAALSVRTRKRYGGARSRTRRPVSRRAAAVDRIGHTQPGCGLAVGARADKHQQRRATGRRRIHDSVDRCFGAERHRGGGAADSRNDAQALQLLGP